jgi:DNA-binding ferritin-like protein
MLSKVEDETEIIPLEAMVKELLMDNEKMIIILKKTYDSAEAAGKHGFSNFLAERMDAHEKHGWFLRSSTRGQQQ